jgi:hypothetical protein
MQSNDITHSVADFVRKAILSNKEYCSRVISRILSNTSHVPVAYNVDEGSDYAWRLAASEGLCW